LRAAAKQVKKPKEMEAIESSSDEEETVKRGSPKKARAQSPNSPRKVTQAPSVVTHVSSKQEDKPARKPRGRPPKKSAKYVDMATSPIVFKD
jgi:hypothetical protein